jgi:hypothetical protein
MLTEHPVYRALGGTPAARQDAYRRLFAEILDEAPFSQNLCVEIAAGSFASERPPLNANL